MEELAKQILMWRNIKKNFYGLQTYPEYNSLEEELDDLNVFMKELRNSIHIQLGRWKQKQNQNKK